MLAITGSAPRFAAPLHVGRPNIGTRESLVKRMEQILADRWLSNDGPMVREFEERVAAIAGVRHCVATCNATLALQIATHALDLREGEVVLPAYTFVATAHALLWRGLTPVFADIEPGTLNLDPEAVELALSPATSAIVGVHLFGRPGGAPEIEGIARRHGLKLIFDAAHAFACSHNGKRIGGFGDCEIFSFHATKFVNSFEGGAVVTNDDALAVRLRLIRNFGFAGYDHVVCLGTNAKMHEASAAMGLTSIESLDDIIGVNRRNYLSYQRELAGLPGLSIVEHSMEDSPNFHYVVIRAAEGSCPLSRDELIAVLEAENVLARRYFWPGCHRFEPYRSMYPRAAARLRTTERIAGEVLVLPTGQTVTEWHVVEIADVLRSALESAPEVRKILAERART